MFHFCICPSDECTSEILTAVIELTFLNEVEKVERRVDVNEMIVGVLFRMLELYTNECIDKVELVICTICRSW